MSTPYASIVGNPFFPSVIKELEKRKHIHSIVYDTEDKKNPEYFTPYFKIRRKPFPLINNNTDFIVKDYAPLNLKFSELGMINKENVYEFNQGVNYIENKGSEFKADPHIISASIGVTNFGFYTSTINFKVPDVHDFEDFKNNWLDWGAPVEIEFGRNNNIEEQYDQNDGNPNKQLTDGFVANFTFQTGENRSITGTITIYSSTVLNLYESMHPQDNKITAFRNFMKARSLAIYEFNNNFIDSLIRNNNIEVDSIVEEGRVRGDEKSKLFYCIMDLNEYETNIRNNKSIGDTRDEQIKIINERIKRIEEEIESIEERKVELKNRGAGGLEGQLRPLNRAKNFRLNDIETLKNARDGQKISKGFRYYWRTFTSGGRGDYGNSFYGRSMRLYDIKSVPIFSPAPYGVDLINSRETYKRISEEISSFSTGSYGSFGATATETGEQMKSLEKIINDPNLYKYALAQYNLRIDDHRSLPWYYISLRALEDALSDFQKEYLFPEYEDDPENILLTKIKLTDVRIRHTDNFGQISKFPDRILINPYNRKYSYNKETGKYTEDGEGEYTLLEDIYVSADHIDKLANDAKSHHDFIIELIRNINAVTSGFLNIERVNLSDYDEDTSKIFTNTLTFFDVGMVEDKKNDKNMYTVNLYDPREKIKNVSVQTNVTDEMQQYAYSRARGIVTPGAENILFYESEEGEVYRKYIATNPVTQDIRDYNQPLVYTEESVPIEAINRYANVTQELLDRVENAFSSSFTEARQRIVNYIDSNNVSRDDQLRVAAILGYIKTYFQLITDLVNSEYLSNRTNNTFQIPLTLEFDVVGISSIIVGQTFRVDITSFPIKLPYEMDYVLYTVTGVSHEFNGTSWTTKISSMPHISYSDKKTFEDAQTISPVQKDNLLLALKKVTLKQLANFR